MSRISKFKDFVAEDLVAVGFGPGAISPTIAGAGRPMTGYSLAPITVNLTKLGESVAEQACAYEANDNPKHSGDDYMLEAKNHINNKLDEMYEKYKKGQS
tara:strand:- start:2777 stop:3076 length:300 start_codon:yes stop_codon:yes gene_type:complete